MSRNLHHPLIAGDFAIALNGESEFEAGRVINQAKAASAFGAPAVVLLVFVENKSDRGTAPEGNETNSLILPVAYSLLVKSSDIWPYLQSRTLGLKGKTPIANAPVLIFPPAWWGMVVIAE